MNNTPEFLIAKKMIQKELLNELYSKGVIAFTNTSNFIKKLDDDIWKLKEVQEKHKNLKHLIVKIPI